MSLSMESAIETRLPSPPPSTVAPRAQPLGTASQSPRRQQRLVVSTLQRHLSPRKFQQMQREQRSTLLRSLPLSPLSIAHLEAMQPAVSASSDPVPWNPAWLPSHLIDIRGDDRAGRAGPRRRGQQPWMPPRGFDVTIGTTRLSDWVRQYELDFVCYESLDKLVQVKLPEALAFVDKLQHLEASASSHSGRPTSRAQSVKRGSIQRRHRQYPEHDESSTRFHERFRVAVFAHLMDRAVLALAQSVTLSHSRSTLLLVRRELLRAIYADLDEPVTTSQPAGSSSDSDDHDDRLDIDEAGAAPMDSPRAVDDSEMKSHALSFFLKKTPLAVKIREDSRRRAEGFSRHEAVLRRVIQSLYRSIGSVFHAWKRFARTRKEERLNRKGAQLTAMVVRHRGLVRSTFIEWSKAALRSKVRRMQEREAEVERVRQQELVDLRNEVFVLRDRNARLQQQLAALQQRYEPDPQPIQEDDNSGEDDGGWVPALADRGNEKQNDSQVQTTGTVGESSSEVASLDGETAPDPEAAAQ